MDIAEEIKNLKEEIRTLTSLKNEYKNEEQGIKLTMNSIYGAIGNNYFACFNPDVAEAVTLQGQDLIKYSSMLLTRYFHEFWHFRKLTQHRESIGIVDACFAPIVEKPEQAHISIQIDRETSGELKARAIASNSHHPK